MRFRFSGCVFGLACFAAGLRGQFVINTTAGSQSAGAGYSGDGGAPVNAQFNLPTGMAYYKGNLYIADTGNNVIRLISNGVITTYAGTQGSQGYSGDGAAANQAELNHPSGLAVDTSGNLFIADTGNNVIRLVGASTGNISTFAGNYSHGAGYTGDGGAATNAELDAPTAVALDSAGNVYVTDSVFNLVRKITVSTGYISTVVGIGATGGSLNHPNALYIDANNNIYIADTNHHVLKYSTTTGALTVVAGTGDVGTIGDNGLATKALLNNPTGLTMDASGNLYIVDANSFRVRAVSPAGIITTVAGTGHVGYSGDGGPALSAYFNFPNSILNDGQGNLYITDAENNVVRDLTLKTPTINTGGVVNSASYQAQLAPGSLASIFGANLSTSTTTQAATPLPTSLGEASVTVNGVAAPVLYASPTLVNFQVPFETSTGNATVVLSVAGTASNSITVPVVAASPGIYTYTSGAAVAQNHDYTLNSASNPAHAGSFIIAYLTGQGAVSPTVADGAATPSTGLYTTSLTPTATIGGASATVLFSGLTPGLIPLWQMNITVPSGLAAGSYPLQVTINGQTSNAATVYIAP